MLRTDVWLFGLGAAVQTTLWSAPPLSRGRPARFQNRRLPGENRTHPVDMVCQGRKVPLRRVRRFWAIARHSGRNGIHDTLPADNRHRGYPVARRPVCLLYLSMFPACMAEGKSVFCGCGSRTAPPLQKFAERGNGLSFLAEPLPVSPVAPFGGAETNECVRKRTLPETIATG
jgi:hypothetical protein